MDDIKIIEGIRASSIESYEVLIDNYSLYIGRVVTKVAMERLTKEDKEELCADVFITLWKNRERLKIKEGYLKGYLGAMARNKTINKLRAVGTKLFRGKKKLEKALRERGISYE